MKGKKVRNSICFSDYDPNRLLKEIQKVEKRRVVKSTNCNDRSSRSHCVVSYRIRMKWSNRGLRALAWTELHRLNGRESASVLSV